jgi:hypothetical protein
MSFPDEPQSLALKKENTAAHKTAVGRKKIFLEQNYVTHGPRST